MKRLIPAVVGTGVPIFISLLLSGCAQTKQKLVFEAITDDQGMTSFKRNRNDVHDNYPADVYICGYETPVMFR